ncbi:MAG: hypothetical protein WCK64_04900, partial [Synechococcaceae cyanobacterium ELA445]
MASSSIISPLVVDISTGAQSLLLKASITDATGFSSLLIYFSNSTGGGNIYASLYGNNLYTGTPKDGSYAGSVQIAASTAIGTYSVSSINVYDTAGNSKSFGGINGAEAKAYLTSIGIDPATLSFQVTGTPPVSVDTNVPQLSKLSLSSNTVNISKGAQSLLLKASITDATGFSSLNIYFSNSTGGGNIYASLYGNNLYTGTPKDGSYAGSVQIAASTAIGTYSVSSINVYDTAGNSKSFGGINGAEAKAYLTSIGIDPATLSFQVTGTPPVSADTNAPQLSKLSLSSNTVNISAGAQSLLLKASITDATGFSSLLIYFSNSTGGGNIYASLYGNNLYTGTPKDGSYAGSVQIAASTAIGTYSVSSINVYDTAGNSKSFGGINGAEAKAYLTSIGIDPATLSFQVTGTPPVSVDTNVPILKSATISLIQAPATPAPLVVDISSGSQALLLKASITDATSFNSLSIGFSSSASQNNYSNNLSAYFYSLDSLITGSPTGGTFAGSIVISSSTSIGSYQVSSLSLSDNAGNYKSFSGAAAQAYLSSIGIDPATLSFQVTGTPSVKADADVPAITKLTMSSNSVDISSGSQALLLKASITDATSFNSLSIGFSGSTSQNNYSNNLSAYFYSLDSLITGSPTGGTFAGSIVISSSTSIGSYQVSSLSLSDNAGNYKSFSGAAAQAYLSSIGIDPATLSFQVTGTPSVKADADVPAITKLTLSSNSVDISSGSQALLLKASITDATSFNSLSIGFSSSASQNNYSNNLSAYFYSLDSLITGSPTGGTFAGSIVISSSTSIGSYQVSSLSLSDNAGNYKSFSGAAAQAYLSSIGIDPATLSFQVTGTPTVKADTDVPAINSLSVFNAPPGSINPATIVIGNPSASTFATIDIDFSDTSGLGSLANTGNAADTDWGYVSLSGPNDQNLYVNIKPENLVSGTNKNGTLRVSSNLSPYLAAGTWSITGFRLYNTAGLSKQAYADSTQGGAPSNLLKLATVLGVDPASLSVNILNRNVVPSATPVVKAIRFGSSSYDVTSGSTAATLEIDFSDTSGLGSLANTGNAADTDWGYVSLSGPNDQNLYVN